MKLVQGEGHSHSRKHLIESSICQHNTLIRRESDLKKDCRKRNGWETLKRKDQRDLTGNCMIRQEL